MFVCKASDVGILEWVKGELESKHKIGWKKGGRMKGGYCYGKVRRIQIPSKRIVTRLTEIGIPERKSFVDPEHPSVPNEFYRHFLRGVFDGDGSATYAEGRPRITFTGSERFLISVRERLMFRLELPENKVGKSKQGNVWFLTWSAQQDVARISRYIYPEGFGFGLKRKFSRLQHFVL